MSHHFIVKRCLQFITLLIVIFLVGLTHAGDLKLEPREIKADTQGGDAIDPGKVQRYLAASFDFETGAQGWTTADFSGGNFWGPAFHVDDFDGLDGGASGGLTPISGLQSLWCGTRDENFHGGAGYGDNWYQVFQTGVFEPTGDVVLSYKIRHDLEVVAEYQYDVLKAQFRNADGEWEVITTYGGQSDVIEESYTISAASLGATTQIAFFFISDPDGSDESDWEFLVFDSDGAAIIDDLVVSYTAMVEDPENPQGPEIEVEVTVAEDFESEELGATTTLDSFWSAHDGGHRGDFAGLYTPGDEVLQEDFNNFNMTNFWGFFDDPAQTNYACGGHPEQGAVPYENEWECAVENAIISPPIDLFTQIDMSPMPAGATGTRVLFDVYMNLPADAAVFYHLRVRSLVGGEWSTWQGADNYVYYGEFNRWVTRAIDASGRVGPEATAVQVALVCWDMNNQWEPNFSGECHTQGPLIDNVQVERYDPEGPLWYDVDRFADVFQLEPYLHGAENARVYLDRTDPEAEPQHMDALRFQVSPAYPATGLAGPEVGLPPIVQVYLSVTRGDLDYDPLGRSGVDLQSTDEYEDEYSITHLKYPYIGSEVVGGKTWLVYQAWQGDDPDHPYDSPDDFHFDLNDFTGSGTEDPIWRQGDVVHYFFTATDNLGHTSYFSHEMTETTPLVEVAAASPSEFHFLPSWEVDGTGDPVDSCENRILLVQNSLDLDTRAVYENALTELGWCWDRFDNPVFGGGLDLALGGVTPEALYHYKAILYAGSVLQRGVWTGSGTNYFYSDFRVLQGFLENFQAYDLSGTGHTGVYLAGPGAATDWDSYEALHLQETYFDFQLEGRDQADLGLPLGPRVAAAVDWNPSEYALGLLSKSGYDVLSSVSGGMTFTTDPQYKALTFKHNEEARTTGVIGTFGLEDIEGPTMEVLHLGKTLEFITGVPYTVSQVPVRIGTVPQGINLNVDDLWIQTPALMYWEEGSTHNLFPPLSGFAADGSECVYTTYWEDGERYLLREFTVPAGSDGVDLTAYFIGAKQVYGITMDNLGETSGMAWGDYNGDGWQDLYITRATQPDVLMRGAPDGRLILPLGTIPNHGIGSQGAAWADYDNDGDQDLYLVTEVDNHLYRYDGNGLFTDVTSGALSDGGTGRSAAWADFDLDGDLDLYIANFGGPNRLLRNDGAAGFVDFSTGPQGDSGGSLAGIWADYDNDGYPDLYIVNSAEPNRLLHNDAGAGFTDVTSPAVAGNANSEGAAWGDYDNDGDPDLFIVHRYNNGLLATNEGGGSFVEDTGPSPGIVSATGAAWCDYNNDGLLDLYGTAVIASNSLRLGSLVLGEISYDDFTPPPLKSAGQDFESVRESAWADLNGDGYLDVLLSESSETYPDTRLVLNAGQLGNHWLELDLQGTAANRDALGARVEIVTSAGSQYRQLYPASGGAQSSRILHFGLGTESFITAINIHWPGGGTQTLTGVAADQLLTVVQETTTPANTEEGTDVTVQPVDEDTGAAPVELTFDEVTTAGSTTVTVAEYTEAPPQSYQVGDPPLVYYLETSAVYTGSIELCFDYSDIVFAVPEEDIRVFHYNVDTDGDGEPDSWGDPVVPFTQDLDNDIICISVTDLSPFAVFAPTYGSIAGQVAGQCGETTTMLPNITVGIYSDGGDLVYGAVTDEFGQYAAPDLPAGDYTVSVVAPIGYVPEVGEFPVTVTEEQAAVADFTLECVNPNGDPRGTGYWKHQVGVALGGNGNAEISAEELCGFLDTIAEHFNNNALNQVVVYQPEGLDTCEEKLGMAKDLLNLRGQQLMISRARQHFMATLLNVAAGNLLLFTEVSEDGATLSQAITFCDYLIDDPDGDHELAKDIAETINKGFLVPAGVIPLTTQNIAYRISNTPQPFALKANRPNPFNPATTIAFSIPQTGQVSLVIYGIDGKLVRTLVREVLPAGGYQIIWNGVDDRGSRVASGVYFYQLIADQYKDTRKMMLIK